MAGARARRRRARDRRARPRLLQARSTSASRAGVLFEIATLSPGFAVDEDPEHLGEELRLPAQHEHLRERLERTLAPPCRTRARGWRHERADLPRAAGRRGRRTACSSSTTGAAPTSTTCSGSATCSTRSGGCTSSRRARRCTLPGWPGHHWYVVPRVGYPDHDTFHAAYDALAALPRRAVGADRHRRRSGPCSAASRWARSMSYSLGLGAGRPAPAGILAFSGFIPVVDGWQPDLAGRERRRRSSPTAATTRSWRSASPAARATCWRQAGLPSSTTSPTPRTTSIPRTSRRRWTGCRSSGDAAARCVGAGRCRRGRGAGRLVR